MMMKDADGDDDDDDDTQLAFIHSVWCIYFIPKSWNVAHRTHDLYSYYWLIINETVLIMTSDILIYLINEGRWIETK